MGVVEGVGSGHGELRGCLALLYFSFLVLGVFRPCDEHTHALLRRVEQGKPPPYPHRDTLYEY